MRTKVTLVLVFLNVALFFFIFKFERSWKTETALREARRRVLGSETANIHSLSVTNPGGTSYTLVRNRDVWTLTQPLDWPANQDAVHSIIQQLQFLENETSFNVADLAKNGQTLADYGLDRPKLTLSFTSSEASAAPANGQAVAGPTTVLQIGDATRVGNRLYVLSPDGARIHVVSRALVDALSVPLDQLRADTLLTIPVFEARALTVQTSGARVRIRRDGGRWMFDTIIVDGRASKMAMDLTIQSLNRLHAASFPSTSPGVLPSASPSLRVTIDGNGRSETLFLGETVNANATVPGSGPRPKPATEFFGQLMNGNNVRSPVFTVVVDNDLLEHLRKAQTDLRERRVLELDAATVTSVTIAAANQASITLQRLDTSADSAWQMVPRGGTATGQQTLAADPAAVRQLLDRLTLLAAANFESDAPSSAQIEAWGFNRPEREITLVKSDGPGGAPKTILLQLGTDTARAVFARVGTPSEPGASVYAVDVDLARDFPIDPKEWRDRTLRTLPATARITGLKLTDLASHETLLDVALDNDGRPTKEGADAGAVQELARQVRTLHARKFLQDAFFDRLTLGGDERTWRYQLDAAIALPSGGAEQTSTTTLYFTERVGGSTQVGGSKEFNAIFEIEQPLLDALWRLTYGPRDPGPQAEKK